VSYLAALQAASEAKALRGDLPAIFSLEDLSRGFASIAEELRREGMRYLLGTEDELRKTLNNEDLFHLSDETSPSHVQVILMVVAAVLRLPLATSMRSPSPSPLSYSSKACEILPRKTNQ
jgi:hypothetical protein